SLAGDRSRCKFGTKITFKPLEELTIGARECIFAEPFHFDPLEASRFGSHGVFSYSRDEGVERDAEVAVGMRKYMERFSDFDPQAQLLFHLAAARLGRAFAMLLLAPGEFP